MCPLKMVNVWNIFVPQYQARTISSIDNYTLEHPLAINNVISSNYSLILKHKIFITYKTIFFLIDDHVQDILQ